MLKLPDQYRAKWILVAAVLMASTFALLQMGVIGKIIKPELLQVFYLSGMFIAFAMAKIRAARYGDEVDKLMNAVGSAKDHLSIDLTNHNELDGRVASLLTLEALPEEDRSTALGSFFKNMMKSLRANPKMGINFGSVLGLFNADFNPPLLPIKAAAANQFKYGLLGTVLGLMIGLGDIDPESITGASEAALQGAYVLVGISVALVTTFFGIIFNRLLGSDVSDLQERSAAISKELAEECMIIERVVNDPDRLEKLVTTLELGTPKTAPGAAS